MRHITIVRAGGLSLITAAIAFLAVFSYLAARFDYPAVLDGSAADVLPRLLNTGYAGRFAWALYGILPLLWIPAGVGAFHALRRVHEGSMRVAMLFAVVSALTMMLGLMRWPSIHWELAQTFVASNTSDQQMLAAVFDGLNSYLGNYIGEFVGELSFSIFFLLSAAAMLRHDSHFPRWMGYLGILTAVAGMIGMFRNVSTTVDIVGEVNNYLLPFWMIVFGVGLMRIRSSE